MSNEIIKQNRFTPSLQQTIEICEQYDIGDLVEIDGGIENTANVNIKILSTKGYFILKIFSASPERLNFISDILNTLILNNVPITMPLKNKEGSYYSEIEKYKLQITKFEIGYPFNYKEKQSFFSGKMLRKFHDVLSVTECEVEPMASIYPSEIILKAGIAKLTSIRNIIPKNQIESIIKLYDNIISKWEFRSNNLPSTLIHGDWHERNQLFSKSNEVCRIFDFEFISRAERLFDIAYALWNLNIYKENMNLARSFLDGYGPLTYKEIRLLPLEIARISYFFICSATLSLNPEYELIKQINKQSPYIKWALSKKGEKTITNLCIQMKR